MANDEYDTVICWEEDEFAGTEFDAVHRVVVMGQSRHTLSLVFYFLKYAVLHTVIKIRTLNSCQLRVVKLLFILTYLQNAYSAVKSFTFDCNVENLPQWRTSLGIRYEESYLRIVVAFLVNKIIGILIQ